MSSAVTKAKSEADDRMPDSDDEDEEEGMHSSTESVDSNASSSSKKKKKKVGVDRRRGTSHRLQRCLGTGSAEEKESNISRLKSTWDRRYCLNSIAAKCQWERSGEKVRVALICSCVDAALISLSSGTYRLQAAIDAARKGDDLWIDLSNSALQLAKTKKV